ncbi:B12-binding domain-containing radical SAM protein [Gemmatimonadota bacterium]
MDLLLIDPVTTAHSLDVEERRKLRRGIGYPGLGLFTVAALTPPDIRVTVIDESVEDIDEELTPDLVGISVQGPTAPYAYHLASRYRARGIPVVLGGIHVSLNPEETEGRADAVVVGEAESTWPELIEDFRKGELKSVYRAESPIDFDSSPPPRRELMQYENYRLPNVVQASKGCPYGCEFCSLYCYVGHVPRFRDIGKVVREIESLPGQHILFADDNIYIRKNYSRDLFRALIPAGKSWVAEATWHIAHDEEALDLAKESGCAGLFIGFDSINQQYSMRKVPESDRVEDIYIEAIRNIQSRGIAVVAAFVFGLDNDDAGVFERSLDVVRTGGANLVNFSALVPYPGTPVYKRLKAEGRITEHDWSKFISPNVCFRPKKMSADELHEGTLRTQREFYSLGHIVKNAVRTVSKLGWAMGLLSLKLNLSQKKNWGKGSSID